MKTTVTHPEARRLLKAGFKLCELYPMSKRPVGDGWQLKPVTTIDGEAGGYGMPLAPNGLCSIDPDNAAPAREGLKRCGFDLEKLMAAGVRTRSTRPNSGGRSTFKAPKDLRWVKFSSKKNGTILELRAGQTNLQDVLPGTRYKGKDGSKIYEQQYANGKCFDDAPELPADFLAWWRRLNEDIDFLREQQALLAGDGAHLSVSAGKGKALAFASPYRREFNAANDVEYILLTHDYDQDERTSRLAPPTATGSPCVRPIPGKDDLWQSDHASDPLHGTFDAWTAFVTLAHGGDIDAATAAYEAQRGDGFDDLGEVEDLGEFENLDAVQPVQSAIGLFRQTAVNRSIARLTPVPVEFNIHGLLQRGQVGMLVAAGGTGKTQLVLHGSVCIALGRPFMGHKVMQGSAYLISADDSQADLDAALGEICRDMRLTPEEIAIVAEKVVVVSLQGCLDRMLLTARASGKGFMATAFARDLTHELVAVPDLRLVVFDTARQFSGVDSTEEAAQITLLSIGAGIASGGSLPSVCVNSHTGKQNARAKVEDQYSVIGSSALADNSRFVLHLRLLDDADLRGEFCQVNQQADEFTNTGSMAPEDHTAVPPTILQLKSTRGSVRVCTPPPMFYVRIGFALHHLTGAHKVNKIESKVVKAGSLREDVLDFIGKNPGCSGRDITGRTRAPGVVSTAGLLAAELAAMEKAGLIRIETGKRNAKKHFLSATN